MSIETANAKRFEKGLTVLTPLEGELLEALENCRGVLCNPIMRRKCKDVFYIETVSGLERSIAHAHGD